MAHKAAGQALGCSYMPRIAVPPAGHSVQTYCAVQLCSAVSPCATTHPTTTEYSSVVGPKAPTTWPARRCRVDPSAASNQEGFLQLCLSCPSDDAYEGTAPGLNMQHSPEDAHQLSGCMCPMRAPTRCSCLTLNLGLVHERMHRERRADAHTHACSTQAGKR